ncbi:6532_t:CDS:2, partial [Entrophospora sp. SA101]
RDAEMFPPHFWSVANNIEYAFPCTINSVEAWYRRLVGCEHLGIFKIIKEIQGD